MKDNQLHDLNLETKSKWSEFLSESSLAYEKKGYLILLLRRAVTFLWGIVIAFQLFFFAKFLVLISNGKVLTWDFFITLVILLAMLGFFYLYFDEKRVEKYKFEQFIGIFPILALRVATLLIIIIPILVVFATISRMAK